MSGRGVTESVVEQAALAWLESVGWQVVNGAEIAPGEPDAERANYSQVILERRLRDELARLNPKLPSEALDDAFRKLIRPDGAELILQNRATHQLLVDGVAVEYRDGDGEIRGAQARVIDFDRPEANDWLAVNQYSVAENKHARRPDAVLFVNGMPLAVVELKNAGSENATIWSAFQQLQTYQAEVPSLFGTNELLVASDEHGKMARERKVPTEPEAIIEALNGSGQDASGSAWRPDRCHSGSTVNWRRLACRSSASRRGTSVRCLQRRSTRPTATMRAASPR